MQKFLDAAHELARTRGLSAISRESLCTAVGVPVGSFTYFAGVNYTDFVREFADTLPLDQCRTVVGRVCPDIRRRQLLAVAVELARETGYTTLSRTAVAERAGVSESNVARLYNLGHLRRDVLDHAIAVGDMVIVRQMVLANDPLVDTIDQAKLKAAARANKR